MPAKPLFGKVLVANRGEIACRVIRALRELSIPSVAVYSDVDRASLAVRMADEAVHIGPAPSKESYLRIDRLIDAARSRGADAIHPGYGFLSENAEFAQACEDAGIVFVGPSPDSIRRMGSKTAARKLAKAAGAPVVPGTEDPVTDLVEARRIANAIGYPVLLKAAAGGGGKGMRRVDSEAELADAVRDASSEAERAFHDGAVYIEKLVERSRHIEIQILGDRHGHLIHLGERECSIQRRHQKVIEESPSPLIAVHPELRHRMGEAAVQAARAVDYYNAGTVEFLVDEQARFYFLEMNTRLQVEHPITELVTGLDLVHWQLRIAAGERLSLRQEDISWRGSALECRIYAEDPDNRFFPSPGLISHLERPTGPGVRLDSGVYPGWTVPLDYDPLLAKLAVWGPDRHTAIQRMLRALDEYYVGGIKTNIPFFRQILTDECFHEGQLHTGFIDEFFARRPAASPPDPLVEAVAVLVAALHSGKEQPASAGVGAELSRWRTEGRGRLFR
ncbi:MAG: acetyl-CoA carboxylase biotin carboxylase subunit [Bryobacteraceae bacterium]|nr:acetyl-CoA carboxylase biotin carboxylase subunit [Bryobacteraceae bacterium]